MTWMSRCEALSLVKVRSLAQSVDYSLELGSAEPVEIGSDIAQAKDTQLELFRQLTVERRTLAIPAEGKLCHDMIRPLSGLHVIDQGIPARDDAPDPAARRASGNSPVMNNV